MPGGARPSGPAPSLLLLLLELPLVEGQLLALKDVAVAAAGLAWARGDAGQQPAALELLLDGRVELLLREPGLLPRDDVPALLVGLAVALLVLLPVLVLVLALLVPGRGLLVSARGGLLVAGRAALRLPAELDAEPLEVPLLVGLGVDLHDGVPHECLRADELVAGGVVDDVQDADLLRAVL
eukprot:CAMPEP_0168417230 /NCGR_PEP_ID=MMETSP0228-20121227/31148_1 /TAXON_ID=133427 /ORGANISM="Protoceratium reticulatum, Strain CCCM 535 (=CCMP 1889)" /LENGTH=181 /DNA_ID=CAMNT_0008431079 /DNA_START=48 /DNA_END=590 /DNA_ORIENTATION=+